MKNIKLNDRHTGKIMHYAAIGTLLALAATSPVLAQTSGGISNTGQTLGFFTQFGTMLYSTLYAVRIPVITGAILWAGYELAFGKHDWKKAGIILAAGFIIGNVDTIVSYFCIK